MIRSNHTGLEFCVVVVGYVNEIREDYDIVAVLRPEISKFEEVYGKHFSRGQIDAEFRRVLFRSSILKEISPEYTLEGLMLKLKLQYFGHLMRKTDSVEKTVILGKIEGMRRRG